MKAKNLQFILQIGTALSFLSIFLVSANYLFPYITSKQLLFNVLVEMMLPFYLILIWRYRQYRLKKKLVAFSLMAYLLVILLSSFLSVDFSLSFWGNAERMLGWFHLSHYFLFFFYLLAAWRNSKEWYYLLSYFVVLGVILSFVYLGGDNRIGNTAYLSGYLLFNLFLALLLFIKSKGYYRFLWLFSLIPIFLALYKAKTSGAFFGLAFALVLLLFLFGILMEKRIYRIWTWSILIIFIFSTILLFSQRDSDWFRDHRLLSGLTFDKPTFQTRLVSWEGAVKEIPNNWFLGVGYGNFAHVFDKQFDSRFLDYARDETYFDRAHNNLIDITATTGVLGLITYLSIFVFLLYYLWLLLKKRGMKIRANENKDFSVKEIIILIALISAYFIQNLAVFDTQITYLSLMLVLAYIIFLSQKELVSEDGDKELYAYYPLSWVMKLVLVLITIFSVFLILINYRSATLFTGVISSYSQIVKGEVSLGISQYKETLEVNSPIKRDARNILINQFNKNSEDFAHNLSSKEILEVIDYIVILAKENLAYNENDAKSNLLLAQTIETGARLLKGTEKQEEMLNEALEYVNKAIVSSPSRAPLYLSKAQILLGLEEYDTVIENIEIAISLNENIPDGFCHLSQIYFAIDEMDNSFEYFEDCLKRDGLEHISLENLLIINLEHYKEIADYDKALQIIKGLEKRRPDDSAVFFELLRVNLYLGNSEESIIAAERLVELEEDINTISSIYIQIANDEIASDREEFAIKAAEIASTLDPSLEEALNDFIEAIRQEDMLDND